MDFLNKINEAGTALVDSVNEKATSALDTLNQAVVDNAGKVQEFGGRVLRKAGQAVSPIPAVAELIKPVAGAVEQYVEEIPERGAIPFLPSAISPQVRTGAGYVKSLAGPLGRPIRILDNPGSSDFYQQTVDAGTYDPSAGTVTFNQNIKDQDEYERLGSNTSNKDFGRYVGNVDGEGTVTIDSDSYGTNDPAELQFYRFREGLNNPDDQEPIGPVGRAVGGLAGVHRTFEDLGWTNPQPFGTKVKVGELKLDP